VSYKSKAKLYLKISDEFKLGSLLTERQNPLTENLSELSKNNVHKAISSILNVDLNMLHSLINSLPKIKLLSTDIKKCLSSGGRLFLGGCGATGRLSLVIETTWRQTTKKNNVISFMAGGDVALISSIEKFEDYPEYGSRQLLDLSFSENDLFIGSSEGGETPFVIGAVDKALTISKLKPYFLFCNPDDILKNITKRTKKLLENKNVKKLNLTHDAQALSGSTRMQASSIIMMAISIALFEDDFNIKNIENDLLTFEKNYEKECFNLEQFINKEFQIYQNNEDLLYSPSKDLAISVLTDTTERSPTFSLNSFENYNDNLNNSNCSLCYLYFPKSSTPEEAWKKLLARDPRTLEWENLKGIASLNKLYGFNFSESLSMKRKEILNKKQNIFKIENSDSNNGIIFSLNNCKHIFEMPLQENKVYYKQLLLKMLLNTHSTIIMGKLNRFDGNIMTWVKPSNNKLIDRAIRYSQSLLRKNNLNISYDEVARKCFEKYENYDGKKSLIKLIVDSFL